jgi:hypothetical protein
MTKTANQTAASANAAAAAPAEKKSRKAAAAAAPAAAATPAPAAKPKKAAGGATSHAKPDGNKNQASEGNNVRPLSAKQLAIPVIEAAIKAGTARKDVLQQLQGAPLNLTAAGANTYYQNVKSGKKGWTSQVEAPAAKAAA